MLTNWQTTKLKEICLVFADGDWIESKDQSSSGIRLVQTGNIGNLEFLDKEARAKYISEETFNRLNCTEIFPGDMLISRLPEPVGRACIIPEVEERMITAVDCTIVRPNELLIDKKFLLYFTFSNEYQYQINKNLSGTTRQRISKGNLGNIEIPLPPIATQQKIVARLDELLSNIAEAKRLRQEAIADTEKILSQTLREIFEEGKGKGWGEKNIGEVSSLMTGATPSTSRSEYYGGNIKWLVSGDIHNKEIFDCKGRINQLGIKNSNAKLLPKNSLLIALNGQGKTKGTVSILRTEATCNQSLVAIIPSDGVTVEYLYYCLNYQYRKIRSMAGDDSRKGLNMKLVREIKFLLPSLTEQQKIVTHLDALSVHIATLRTLQQEQLADLKKLEKAYLREAFRGELI